LKEIRALNTLRGISALIVVIAHYTRSTGLLGGYSGRGSGQLGVMLFFMISGFLMAFLYLRKPFNHHQVRKFIIARTARVIPLFVILVILSYILQKNGVTRVLYNIPDETSLISHLLLLRGISVFWTIPPEIHFYIFFIFLWWVYSLHKYIYITLMLMIFAALYYYNFPMINFKYHQFYIVFNLIKSLPYFFMGMIFGLLYPNWKYSDEKKKKSYILVFLLIPLLYPVVFVAVFGYRHEMWQDIRVLISVSIVFFSIIFLVPTNSILLVNKWGDFLGKISYSLYLIHMLVLRHFKINGRINPEMYFLPYIIISLILAILSYKFLEKPLRNAIRVRYLKKT